MSIITVRARQVAGLLGRLYIGHKADRPPVDLHSPQRLLPATRLLMSRDDSVHSL